MTRTAQCACGSASISVSGEPRMHGVCHCTNCKRRTGSAFGVSAYFLRSDVTEISGEMLVYGFHHPTRELRPGASFLRHVRDNTVLVHVGATSLDWHRGRLLSRRKPWDTDDLGHEF